MEASDGRLRRTSRSRRIIRPWGAHVDAIVTLSAAVAVVFVLVLGSELKATSGLSNDDLVIYDRVIRATDRELDGPYVVVRSGNSLPFIEAWPRKVERLPTEFKRAVYDLNSRSDRVQGLGKLSDLGYKTVEWGSLVESSRKEKRGLGHIWVSTIGYNRRASTAVVMRAYWAKNERCGSGLYLLVFEDGAWHIEDFIEFRRR
jgi:hypothetical protein